MAGYGKWAGPDGNTIHASAALPTDVSGASVTFDAIEHATAGESGPIGGFGERPKKGPDTLGNGVGIWFRVPDVDTNHAFVQENGAWIEQAPTDQLWGDRTFTVRTPDGYLLHVASPIEGHEPPEGMRADEGQAATQATASGTVEIELPGQSWGGHKPSSLRALTSQIPADSPGRGTTMTDQATQEETGSIRVERFMRAPAERIYKAFLDPHAQAKFSPPHGWVAHFDTMEPEVGGRFHGTFRSLDGDMEHSFGGRYLELEEASKIRLDDRFDTDAEEMQSVMETTITLEEAEDGTKVVIEQTGIPAPIPPEDAETGWSQSLDLLTLLVEFDAEA